MKTFIVRLFVADDLPGVHGTIERPGDQATPFHGVRELLRRLREPALPNAIPAEAPVESSTGDVEGQAGGGGG